MRLTDLAPGIAIDPRRPVEVHEIREPGIPPRVDIEVDAQDRFVRDLVSRAQQGDVEAFGALYDRYVNLIYRYVYYRVGSAELAEDLTSETFLRALRRLDSFSWQGRDIGAWFVTIARNLITDHFKSSRYRLEISASDLLSADRTANDDAGPEAAAITNMTNETLLAAIRHLVPEQQECVVLRFLQGLTLGETALAMHKNEGAIKALQYRAVKSLARQLRDGI